MPTKKKKSVLVFPFWKTLQWSGNREGTRIVVQHTEKACLKKVGGERAVGTFELLFQLSEVPNRLSHFQQLWAPSACTTFSSPIPAMVFTPSFNNLVPYQWLSPTYVSWQPLQGFLATQGLCEAFHRHFPSVSHKTSLWLAVAMLPKHTAKHIPLLMHWFQLPLEEGWTRLVATREVMTTDVFTRSRDCLKGLQIKLLGQ